jgi:hypothetical protein
VTGVYSWKIDVILCVKLGFFEREWELMAGACPSSQMPPTHPSLAHVAYLLISKNI